MKILFITSCLEPGRDGVGDYLYRLADYLMRLGHDVCLLALKDHFIDEFVETQQSGSMSSFQVLRFPEPSFDLSHKPKKIREHIDAFQPDWISFQFVPYAWNEKGVVRGLRPFLKFLTRGYALHFFCHELWIGASTEYDLKQRLLGRVQKTYIRSLLRSLKPAVVHTSNSIYQDLLQETKVPAEVLPLAATIAYKRPHDFRALYALFEEKKLSFSESQHGDYFLCLHFGTLHEEWEPRALFECIDQYCTQSSKTGIILTLGAKTKSATKIFQDYGGVAYESLLFSDLGIQSESVVASLFSFCDLGLSSTPWVLRDKSSAVMCMREQGLPIVFTRDDWRLRGRETHLPEESSGIYLLNERFKSDLHNGLKTPSVLCNPSCVAMQLLQSLVSASAKK